MLEIKVEQHTGIILRKVCHHKWRFRSITETEPMQLLRQRQIYIKDKNQAASGASLQHFYPWSYLCVVSHFDIYFLLDFGSDILFHTVIMRQQDLSSTL